MGNYCGGSIVFEYTKDNFWKLNIPLGYQKNPMTTSSIKVGKRESPQSLLVDYEGMWLHCPHCRISNSVKGSNRKWMGLQRYPAKSLNLKNQCKFPPNRGFYYWWKLEEQTENNWGKAKGFLRLHFAGECKNLSWGSKQSYYEALNTQLTQSIQQRNSSRTEGHTKGKTHTIWNQTAGQEQWR